MGKSIRDRVRFNRRRLDIRKYLSIKNALITSCFVLVCIMSFSYVSGILLARKVQKSTIVYKAKNEENVILNSESNKPSITPNEESNIDNIENEENIETEEEQDAFVDVDNANHTDNITDDNSYNQNSDESVTDELNFSDMSLTILGEIMMGGQISENVNYIYTTPFKGVYMETGKADFTYANFSTNITNLEKIENAKSKYLVTKSAVSSLSALGIDCVSIASDHIADYDSDIVKGTINTLEDNEIFVAGREDTPVYFEKGDKKIAIFSTNSVIIGTTKNYSKLGISVYSDNNLIKNIKEAKKSADLVIVDVHWGKEYTYGVTSQMRQISKLAIDNGADMVIGSHAIGIYPLESYKGKPIIFSTGYLIGDSNLYVGKESYIFDIHISKDKKIDKITMTPLYIKNKSDVLIYSDYNVQKSTAYLELYNRWNTENGFDSKIIDGKIVVNL